MPKISLVPDIDHCIETVAKQQYAEIIRRLLASEENKPEFIEIAELLRNFLVTADFKKLRGESEKHLIDGKHVEFVIYTEGGFATHEMLIRP